MLRRALSGDDGETLISYKPQGSTVETVIDLWAVLREYIALLSNPDTQYHVWEQEDKARYGGVLPACERGSDARC